MLAGLLAAGRGRLAERKATGRLQALTRETALAADLAGRFAGSRSPAAGRTLGREPESGGLLRAARRRHRHRPESVKGIETRRVPQAKDSPYDELATMVRLAAVSQDNGEFLGASRRRTRSTWSRTCGSWRAKAKAPCGTRRSPSLLVYRPDTIDTEGS